MKGHRRQSDQEALPASFLLGIDGGGTACRARLCSLDGTLLGEGRGGPANARLGLDTAFAEVLAAAREALSTAALDEAVLGETHAVLGLAGVNLDYSFDEAKVYSLPFARAILATDTEIARLGAHRGCDGGIVIVGTGSCAEGRAGDKTVRLGGWGFELGDQGSGATLGRDALRHSLLAHDGMTPPSNLAQALLEAFDKSPDNMVRWAETARPRDYAGFAPLVIDYARDGDPVAQALIQNMASGIGQLIVGLVSAGIKPVALVGGLAKAIRPWLDERAVGELVEPMGTALDGAVLLAKRTIEDQTPCQ